MDHDESIHMITFVKFLVDPELIIASDMGVYGNIGGLGSRPFSIHVSEIVRLISSQHYIQSDLDLYATALCNISESKKYKIEGNVALYSPFIVVWNQFRYRVSLFNELVFGCGVQHNYRTELSSQYEDKIKDFLSDSHNMLVNGQLCGYFAAIITENTQPTSSSYPREDKFEYYYPAEPDVICPLNSVDGKSVSICKRRGRLFRIVGETESLPEHY